MSNEAVPYRVVLIGNASVGKTSIVRCLSGSDFVPDGTPTVGAAFVLHVEKVNGTNVDMQVWDTAGQERFRALGPIYYRNANCAVVVFSMTDSGSFDSMDKWITTFIENAEPNAIVFIVGNKMDLADDHTVSLASAEEWAKVRGYHFCVTSACTGDGVSSLFRRIAHDLRSVQISQSMDITVEKREGPCC